MPLLSVIVPVYNEAKTIRQILEKINSVGIDKEIIVVDDGSCDGTEKILENVKYNNLRVIHHSSNRGKGAAFLTGLSHARGDFIIIQDADLEYEPGDYLILMEEIKQDRADIVMGARFKKDYRGLFMVQESIKHFPIPLRKSPKVIAEGDFLVHRFGNWLITGLVNLLFNLKLNDCFTCYKLFRRDTINLLNLNEQSFTIETEIVAKAAKKALRIIEVPISYHPRPYSEGKKIRCKDGIRAIMTIIKYRFID